VHDRAIALLLAHHQRKQWTHRGRRAQLPMFWPQHARCRGRQLPARCCAACRAWAPSHWWRRQRAHGPRRGQHAAARPLFAAPRTSQPGRIQAPPQRPTFKPLTLGAAMSHAPLRPPPTSSRCAAPSPAPHPPPDPHSHAVGPRREQDRCAALQLWRPDRGVAGQHHRVGRQHPAPGAQQPDAASHACRRPRGGAVLPVVPRCTPIHTP
jgi:hypothetical protein